MSRSQVLAGWTLLLSIVLAAGATVLTIAAPTGALLPVQAVPAPVLGIAVAVTFLLSEHFLVNVEFRRQALVLTLAGVPLLVGALILPPITLVIARIVGSVIAFSWQRVPNLKTIFNTAAYAFEAALDVMLLHLLVGSITDVSAWSGIAVVGILAFVDQLMCLLVLVMIRIHNGPLSRQDAVDVQVPAGVLSVIASSFGYAAMMLIGQGTFGLSVVIVLAAVGTLGYRGYAKTRRRHQSLALVHEFVAEGLGAQSMEALAERLLGHIRRLLRAATVELLLLDSPAQGAEPASALVLTVEEDDQLTIVQSQVDASDWVRLRALTDDEPMLAARGAKDPALRRWLSTNNLRDAVLVGLPASSGVVGTLSVSDRLGETSTFTPDDLTLLQTLTGHLAVAVRSTRLLDRLSYDATHDSLTGLSNRAHLTAQIDAVLGQPALSAAVLLLDLDRFKEVNDALGHAVGDRLLIAVAERLLACVPPEATVARLGGDEFAILIPGLDHATDSAKALAVRIADQLAEPIAFEEAMLTPEASIGVAVTTPACPQSELLRQADTAMYEAKTGELHVAVYHSDMDSGRVERLAMLADLRNALTNSPEQFALYYQPKMDLGTGAITSAEALVRWNHPALGVIAPDRFVHLAETTGLIGALTPLVLHSALRECARWTKDGVGITVAVNLSARNISDPELPGRVADALRDTGVAAENLILEITESSVMGDPAQTLPILQELDALGVCLSLDDFGTGYSSLSYLQRLPVREVKIDRSFVLGLAGDNYANSQALIRSIAGLGSNLGLRVVAEGIEDAATLAELKKLGCNVGQGYFISRPLPAGQLREFLLQHAHQPAVGLTLVSTTG